MGGSSHLRAWPSGQRRGRMARKAFVVEWHGRQLSARRSHPSPACPPGTYPSQDLGGWPVWPS
eukprot:4970187-Alexandrium_andersonii.AAC.1